MNKLTTKNSVEAPLPTLTREKQAKEILSKADSRLPCYLASSAGVGVCLFLVNSSGFDAPIVIRVFLITAVIGVILLQIENFMIRRKLNAVIELLLIQDNRRPFYEERSQGTHGHGPQGF